MAQRSSDYPQPAGQAFPDRSPQIGPVLAPASAADALRPTLIFPAWAMLLAVLVFAALLPALALRWQFIPFILGMVFLGLPHGALDHLAPLFVLHRKLTPRYLLLFMLGYGALVLAYLAFWYLSPPGALAVFLLFSWLHWGQGDAYFLEVFAGQPAPRSVFGRLLIWAVRGGLPIVLPPLAHPAAFSQFAAGILGWYGGGSAWHISAAQRGIGLTLLAFLTALYLWQSWRLQKRVFRLDAGEIVLLGMYFWIVPPILAVGVYFCVWHSARHLARLMRLDSADWEPLERGQVGRCALRSAQQALPMTLGALGLLGGLLWGTGRVNVNAGSLVYLYLSLIAALTFPHFLLVLWMDWKELSQHDADPVIVSRRGDLPGSGF